MDLINQK